MLRKCFRCNAADLGRLRYGGGRPLEIATDFARTFDVLKTLPCDVFLGAHGNYYGMHAKYERLKSSDDNPFVDPTGYQAYVAEKEQAYLTTLDKQRAEEATGIKAAVQPFVKRQELAGAVMLVADKVTTNPSCPRGRFVVFFARHRVTLGKPAVQNGYQ